MKKLLSILFILPLFLAAQVNHLPYVKTLNELKALPVTDKTPVLLIGKDSIGDNKGGVSFYWDSTSTDSEDLTYLNVIQKTGINTGRWKRTNQKIMVVPQGIVVMNNGIKTLYTTATTDASGNVTINLTLDNTSNGTAIFTTMRFYKSEAATNSTDPNAYVDVRRTSTSGNLKTVTFKATKPTSSLINLLGINVITTMANAPSVACLFEITGQ